MSVDDADKQHANPNYGKERGYGINCQTCSPAYALRLLGFNVTAKSNTPGTKLEYLSKGNQLWEQWLNLDGTPAKHTSMNDWLAAHNFQRMTPKRYIKFFEDKCNETGFYMLSIGWQRGGGHATILPYRSARANIPRATLHSLCCAVTIAPKTPNSRFSDSTPARN